MLLREVHSFSALESLRNVTEIEETASARYRTDFRDESKASQEGQKVTMDRNFLSQSINPVLSHVDAVEIAKNPP